MMDGIKGPFTGPVGGPGLSGVKAPAEGDGSFGSVLKESIEKVNELQKDADQSIEALAKGESKNIHDTMIAIEKANLSFNMMLQVRNKLLAAYEEIMRMQV